MAYNLKDNVRNNKIIRVLTNIWRKKYIDIKTTLKYQKNNKGFKMKFDSIHNAL